MPGRDHTVPAAPDAHCSALDDWPARAFPVLARRHAAGGQDGLDVGHRATVHLAALAEWLPATLQQLVADPDRWILILETVEGGGGRYVQYLLFEDGSLVAETVSNEYLAAPRRWSAADHAKLRGLGWAAPSSSPNWSHLDPRTGADWLRAARLGYRTLRQVFGLGPGDPVEVTLFSSSVRGGTAARHRR